MTPLILQTIISACTFIASVGVSAFIVGVRWGGVQQELRFVDKRLAKIEGMFEYQLKRKDN